MFSAATRACTLGAGLATRACRPNAWQHHQWCGAQTGQRAIRVDDSSQDLHSASCHHPAERQSRRMHTQQAASTATAPLAPVTACAMLVVMILTPDGLSLVARPQLRNAHPRTTYTRTYAHAHAHACTCTCTCTCTRTRTRIQARTRTHARTNARTHTLVHTSHAGCAARHRVEYSFPIRSRRSASPTQSRALLPGSIWDSRKSDTESGTPSRFSSACSTSSCARQLLPAVLQGLK
jgi:hypothetical protein